MSEISFDVLYSDVVRNQEALEVALTDLTKSIENIQALFEDEQLLKRILFVRKVTQSSIYRQLDNNCEVFMKHKFYEYLTRLLAHLSPTCGQLVILSRDKIEAAKVTAFDATQYIINFIVSNSSSFRIEFFKVGGTRELFNFLKNKDFVQNFNSAFYFSTILGNINWLSRHADAFKNEWRELDVVSLLLEIASKFPDCKMPAYSAFANIANDAEISTLPDMHVIVPQYIHSVVTSSTEFNKPSAQIKRARIPFLEDDSDRPQLYEVYFVRIDLTTTHSLTGILLTLYRLSINNKIKYDLYVKYNLKDHLPVIIYKGSDIEKKYSLQLLAQLCFDPLVNDLVFTNEQLMTYIKTLTSSSTMKAIRNLCEQILWSIETSHKVANAPEASQKNELSEKQIMISYNSASRSLCIRIKEELEKVGFRVWIDVNEIHGSSLESMARAIETSDYVLLCITEKYRQSINCQAEAQYSFKLQKKIVPCIMQEGYERVDGWLGMIIGDKIYVNFIKYTFEESIKRLMNEVCVKEQHRSLVTEVEKFNRVMVKPLGARVNPPAVSNSGEVMKWSEQQVAAWFESKNVHSEIVKEMRPCDGDLLYQMHLLQIEAPEFFYQSITKGKGVDLRSALLFSKNLKELFLKKD